MRVIGTAGHVDHGKSTLVRALTGIDPDRLKEEKARGMTIDLGFAWMELPLVAGHVTTVGIVDVPGHLDFIKNMLAGVGGIDAAVLVIAADEGVMPQTREHLAILDLLAIPAVVVALTKVDAVDDPDWLDLVELDIVELLGATRYAGADIVRVAALKSVGLAELRTRLAAVLTELPPRRNRNLPRLPVDRVFTLSGFGTIVTGTLADGEFEVGQPVEVQPGSLAARIRGMQSHSKPVDRAEPGSRLAINLSGVGADEVRRGDVVGLPGVLVPTLMLDVSFRLLADVPKSLVHNQAVELFVGASETRGRVRLLGREELAAGEEGFLQLRLERPVVAAAGDRFILRMPSPSRTLGGGVVLNPQPGRRWRRFDDNVLARLAVLAQGTPADVVAQTLARKPFATMAQVLSSSGLDTETARDALLELQGQGSIIGLTDEREPPLILRDSWSALREQTCAMVGDYHRLNPLRRGMPRADVRGGLVVKLDGRREGDPLPLRHFNALIASFVDAGALEANEQLLWLPGFAVQLTESQATRVQATTDLLASAGTSPPAPDAVLASLGGDALLMEHLLDDGRLVRVGTNLVMGASEFEVMVEQARGVMADKGTLTLAEARDLWQTSRKYAQAVLEEMDARRITRREGDVRVLR